MFYSHDLLSPKRPLGVIWLVATKQQKLGRRKLAQLNLSEICEYILSPPVPLALRLSGILMGGVVAVYNEKVSLLYRDALELRAGVAKAIKCSKLPVPTIPKVVTDSVSNTIESFGSQDMDSVEVPELILDDKEGDCHQVDATLITLVDGWVAADETHDRFQIFDEPGNEDARVHPLPLVPQPVSHRCKGKRHLANHKKAPEVPFLVRDETSSHERRIPHTKARKSAVQFDEVMGIRDEEYSKWKNDCSDIVRIRKRPSSDAKSVLMISTRVDKLFADGDGQVYFPAPLFHDPSVATMDPTVDPLIHDPSAATMDPTGGIAAKVHPTMDPLLHDPLLHSPSPCLKELRHSPSTCPTEIQRGYGMSATVDVPAEIWTHERPSKKRPLAEVLEEEASKSFKRHLNEEFETRGNPRVVSLDNLARGKNRSSAASMFFQTCVLASRGEIRVDQKEPYGDIGISRSTEFDQEEPYGDIGRS